jgi:CubicO group peptidase (beta-lactamase class C family)
MARKARRRLNVPNERIAIAVSGILLFATAILADVQAGKPTFSKELTALFSGVTRPMDPGLAVIVRSHGRTVFEQGYGVRDLKAMEKIDGTTNFRLASVTKQFTAMAVMLLVRDGKLHYNEPLTEVFPDFPSYGKFITIRNLLNHTSGLMDYESLLEKEYTDTTPEKIPQIHDSGVLALMEQQSGTKFPPGTKWEYSNSGYAVLAMAVEEISGEPFGKFLEERIFVPLKMRNTIAFESGKNEVVNRAFGFTKDGDAWKETDQSPTSAVLGDGGIYSSVKDLAKWDDALEHHTLISAQEMRPALTSARAQGGSSGEALVDRDGKPVFYGFGWFLDPYKGHERIYHDGDTVGFRSTVQRFTDDKLTVIVLCNRANLNPQDLAQRAADIVFASQ